VCEQQTDSRSFIDVEQIGFPTHPKGTQAIDAIDAFDCGFVPDGVIAVVIFDGLNDPNTVTWFEHDVSPLEIIMIRYHAL